MHKLIEELAIHRANEIFTKEFVEKATDSWYYEEHIYFKTKYVELICHEPTHEETNEYMSLMYELFYKKMDEYFGDVMAQKEYNNCINSIKDILETISYANLRWSKFNIDDSIIKTIKDIGNIFVEKHNEFCKKDSLEKSI